MMKFFAAMFIGISALLTAVCFSNAETRPDNYFSMKNKLIMLDAGHGGDDSGAARFNVREADLNLAVSLYLQKLLKAAGASVILTRPENKAVSLNQRFEAIEKNAPDIFISLHHNDSSDKFYENNDFKNASEVYFSALNDRGNANIWLGICFYESFRELHLVKNIKLRPGYFRVIRSKSTPSLLMEPYYMGDKSLITTASSDFYIKHEALRYFKAIASYFSGIKEYEKSSNTCMEEFCNRETCDVFLSAPKNYDLSAINFMLSSKKIKTLLNGGEFVSQKHISEYYIAKMNSIAEYFDETSMEEYIEAIRSNASDAGVHISLSCNPGRAQAVYFYYRSDKGKKIAQMISDNLKRYGFKIKATADSFYILSSTSAVTVNINLSDNEMLKKHNAFKVSISIYKAIGAFLNRF